ncbi:hypothetical protein F5Y04DRAFT_262447 [Hypomontagnella monticulosa]|nr:hypothetical protein F5Y04DRAFT_262447 [Hypomontagnella monticulosa]
MLTRYLQQCSIYLQFPNVRHFACWVIFGGTLVAFSLIHFRFIDFHGKFCRDGGRIPSEGALPGECFYFLRSQSAQLGIISHISLIIPAALLACLQFVPRIRHKAINIHRICGRVSLVLALIGAVGVIPTLRHAFGGELAAQCAGGGLTILFIWAQLKAYLSIKRGLVNQHRAWMLRSWFYAGGIVTMRVIMFASAFIVSRIGGYYMAQPCDKIDFVLRGREKTLSRYPGCEPFYNGENPTQHVVVRANMITRDIVELFTAFNITYAMAGWLAFTIHIAGIEIFLRA